MARQVSYIPEIAPEVLATANGACCFECSEPLHPPLGAPALCQFCASKIDPEEREGFLVAPRASEQSVVAAKTNRRKKQA